MIGHSRNFLYKKLQFLSTLLILIGLSHLLCKISTANVEKLGEGYFSFQDNVAYGEKINIKELPFLECHGCSDRTFSGTCTTYIGNSGDSVTFYDRSYKRYTTLTEGEHQYLSNCYSTPSIYDALRITLIMDKIKQTFSEILFSIPNGQNLNLDLYNFIVNENRTYENVSDFVSSTNHLYFARNQPYGVIIEQFCNVQYGYNPFGVLVDRKEDFKAHTLLFSIDKSGHMKLVDDKILSALVKNASQANLQVVAQISETNDTIEALTKVCPNTKLFINVLKILISAFATTAVVFTSISVILVCKIKSLENITEGWMQNVYLTAEDAVE